MKIKKKVITVLIALIFIALPFVINYLFKIFDLWGGKLVIVPYTFNIIFIGTLLFLVILVILENGNPVKTLSWVIVILLLPLVGIALYLYFGRNFRKEKIFSRKGLADLEKIEKISENQLIDLQDEVFLEKHQLIKQKLNIVTLLLKNSKALLTENNSAQVLNNGVETFDAIMTALNSAQHHIHLEYYIIEDDVIGSRIKNILIDKAKAGIEVRLIYDDVGSWGLTRKYKNDLKQAGVEVHAFMPVRFPLLASKFNYRNHRKIIVVDGHIGFVGGLNIADRYLHGSKKLGPWRDMHLKLVGEAAQSLQTVFITDWYFASEKNLVGEQYFPQLSIGDKTLIQITTSGPDSDWASIMQAYFAAIATAKKYIFITTPYFMPNESVLTALKTAALSGVDVRLILPSRSDMPISLWCSFSYIGELLASGVRVFKYKKGFVHAKLMVVDDIFSSIGTANMDVRSFDQNFEVNAQIYDQNIAEQLSKNYEDDMQDSEEVHLSEFSKRPLLTKLKESLARMLTPLL